MLCKYGSTGLRQAAGTASWDSVVQFEGRPDPTFGKWENYSFYTNRLHAFGLYKICLLKYILRFIAVEVDYFKEATNGNNCLAVDHT